MAKKYVIITAISQYRMRYIVELEDGDTDPKTYMDYVVSNEANDFSQLWLGEIPIDAKIMTKEELLRQFDEDMKEDDAEIFVEWSDEQKMQSFMLD